MVLLMMEHFVKYCHLVPRMVSSTVFPRYINLVARFALLSPLLTFITVTLPPILFGYFNLTQLISLLSRTPSALQNGPRHTIIMANICPDLTLVHSSPTFHNRNLSRQIICFSQSTKVTGLCFERFTCFCH